MHRFHGSIQHPVLIQKYPPCFLHFPNCEPYPPKSSVLRHTLLSLTHAHTRTQSHTHTLTHSTSSSGHVWTCLQELEIIDHRLCQDGTIEVHIQEQVGAERDAWVSEKAVSPELLTSYYKQLGSDRQADKAKKKRRRRVPRPEPVPLSDPLPSNVLPQMSVPEDLAAVSCATHKEDTNTALARTAGVLAVCISSGIILLVREIFGSESLSQRYITMAAAHEAIEEATCCVHDDACHMMKFSLKRRQDGQACCLLLFSARKFCFRCFRPHDILSRPLNPFNPFNESTRSCCLPAGRNPKLREDWQRQSG